MRPFAQITSTTEAIDGRASLREPTAASPAQSGSLATPSEPLDLPTAPRTITTPGANTLDTFPEMIAWDDGFLAVWNRSNNSGQTSVLAQRFDTDGDAVGGIMTIQAAATGVTGKAEMVDVGGGKVAVFWQIGTELKGAFLNPATGALTGTRTVVTNPADWMHDVVRLANGDIAMATSQWDGMQADINLLVLNDANLAQVSLQTLDTFAAPSNTYDHTITSLGTGGVMLYRDRDTNQLFAQKFTAAGALSGAAQKINTTTISLPTAFDGTYFKPQAVELEGGGYAAVWVNVEGSGGDRVEVRARVFDASGAPVAQDFLVNSSPAGNQYMPNVVALEGGVFAVTWVSDVGFSRQTMVRYFDSEGHALTGDLVAGAPSIFTSNVDHQTAVMADGMIADLYPEGGYTALTVDGIRPPVFGSSGADTLDGTAGDDVIIANGGADTIDMTAGGIDVVNGGDGVDVIDFGATYETNDNVDGGAQADTVMLGGPYFNIQFQNNFINVEKLLLAAGFDYEMTLHNAMTAAGKSLTVDGSALGAGDVLKVYGTNESDGSLVLFGGAAADFLYDGQGADVVRGGAGADLINIAMGGADVVRGDDGNDLIQAGGLFTLDDTVDGDAGTDTLSLIGNYAVGVTFKASTMVDIEKILLGAGSNYNLTLHNGNVAAGTILTVDGSALASFNWLRLDGSAETNGALLLKGGAGADTLIGGAGADALQGGEGTNTFDTSFGGADVVTGGTASDLIQAGAGFNPRAKLNGGDGIDSLRLNGDYADLQMKSKTLKSIETIELGVGHDYRITMDTANVAAGQLLSVNAIPLGQADTLYFNGRAELNGRFEVHGGFGDDTIIGGAGNDALNGNWSEVDYTGNFGPGFGDVIDMSRGGNDASTCYDSATFLMGGALTADDRIRAGSDIWDFGLVILDGKYDTRITMNALTMAAIDEVRLGKGHDYNVDVFVAEQSVVKVDGSKLGLTDNMNVSVNGSAITKGVLIGGAGADTLIGSGAGDSITGGGGNDVIQGGAGADTLSGGAGADRFIFASGFDEVTDLGNADTLDVSAVDANSNTGGDDAFILIGAADFSGVAGQLQVRFNGTNTVVTGDTNGDGAGDTVMFSMAGDYTGYDNFVL